MRAQEFMESAGATTSGAVATVPVALGAPITRTGGNFFTGMVTSDPTPNTPRRKKPSAKRKSNK